MLIKQRDNEIAILVGYLNKKKDSGADVGVPVQRAKEMTFDNQTANESPSQYSSQNEESKQPTLYQMMKGTSPRGGMAAQKKSAADKRADFELAQDTIKQAHGIPEQMVQAA
jgi:hypothetical protein